jgi:hypothetical protein
MFDRPAKLPDGRLLYASDNTGLWALFPVRATGSTPPN